MPTVIVPNQTKPGYLAQDAAALYWIAGGMVMSVPKSGGMPKALGAVPPSASALVAEPDPAGAVFVVVGQHVLRLPKDGSGGGIVFSGAAAEPPADTIAASASSLYVLQYDQTLAIEGVAHPAHGQGRGRRDRHRARQRTGDVEPRPEERVLARLRCRTSPRSSSRPRTRRPGRTTAVYTLGINDDLPTLSTDIAIDDGFFYWSTTDATSGAAEIVARKREAAAAVVAIYRGSADDTFAFLTLDTTHVYFIETRTSSLLRVAKSGGDVETLLVGLKAPSGLVVDATAI